MGVNIINPGLSYSTEPYLIFEDDCNIGTGAKGYAVTKDGKVDSVVMTSNGANYIGVGNELGSLVSGKLADLIIMDKNPLEDIKNSNSVIYTMINGRLYDVNTMNEIGNYTTKRSPFYFEKEGYNQGVPLNFDTNSFIAPTCSCHE